MVFRDGKREFMHNTCGTIPSYILKRSKRKTLAIQIGDDLQVVVRAPMRMSLEVIEGFVESHRGWILRHLRRRSDYLRTHPEPDERQMHLLHDAAREYIPGRVEQYARIMGLQPTAVKITSAKTRFGSCSAKDSLCFSCLLMRYPPEGIDYVVVHELAHIHYKNHGKAFYALIEQVLPDYRDRIRLLKNPE